MFAYSNKQIRRKTTKWEFIFCIIFSMLLKHILYFVRSVIFIMYDRDNFSRVVLCDKRESIQILFTWHRPQRIHNIYVCLLSRLVDQIKKLLRENLCEKYIYPRLLSLKYIYLLLIQTIVQSHNITINLYIYISVQTNRKYMLYIYIGNDRNIILARQAPSSLWHNLLIHNV